MRGDNKDLDVTNTSNNLNTQRSAKAWRKRTEEQILDSSEAEFPRDLTLFSSYLLCVGLIHFWKNGIYFRKLKDVKNKLSIFYRLCPVAYSQKQEVALGLNDSFSTAQVT